MKVEITVEQTYLFEAERDVELMEEQLDLMRRQMAQVEKLYKHGVQLGANNEQRATMQSQLHNMCLVYTELTERYKATDRGLMVMRLKMEQVGIFSTMPVLVPYVPRTA